MYEDYTKDATQYLKNKVKRKTVDIHVEIVLDRTLMKLRITDNLL